MEEVLPFRIPSQRLPLAGGGGDGGGGGGSRRSWAFTAVEETSVAASRVKRLARVAASSSTDQVFAAAGAAAAPTSGGSEAAPGDTEPAVDALAPDSQPPPLPPPPPQPQPSQFLDWDACCDEDGDSEGGKEAPLAPWSNQSAAGSGSTSGKHRSCCLARLRRPPCIA